MNYDGGNPRSVVGRNLHHCTFENPPFDSSFGICGGVGGGAFHPMAADGVFLPGKKRGFPFSSQRGGEAGGSPDRQYGGGFVKLFVGSVPRTATEEDIRPPFEDYGHVIEVALIKDRKTGHQQGCCFIKYATLEEAERAISALHNQYILPGGVAPIQVRYADGQKDRIGYGNQCSIEYKLFVGSLNRQAVERDVEEIFAPYGIVEDIYLMRDEKKQSRGCGFVKFSRKDMALAAMTGLNGIYTMRGCEHPLIVRFADPKRPRAVDPKSSAPEGPGYGPQSSQPYTGIQQNHVELPCEPKFPGNRSPVRPRNLTPTGVGAHFRGNQTFDKSCDSSIRLPSSGGSSGMVGASVDASPLDVVSTTSFRQQQISPQKKPLRPSHNIIHPLQPQPLLHTPQPQTSHIPVWQPQHTQAEPRRFDLEKPLPASEPFAPNMRPILRQLPPTSLPQQQQQPTPSNIGIPPNFVPAIGGQPGYKQPQQAFHSLQHSPSQFATLLSKQTQSLQASFQSSQQAFSQLQHQLQLMHPSGNASFPQQNPQFAKPEPKWVDTTVPQTVSSANSMPTGAAAAVDVLPPTSIPSLPASSQTAASVNCNWTEHTSPDGYKYYYNNSTGESRWEKPVEFTLYQQLIERVQQEQKPVAQEPGAPSRNLTVAAEPLPQTPHLRMQSQFYQQQQPQQQHPFPSQGVHMAQEWAWRK